LPGGGVPISPSAFSAGGSSMGGGEEERGGLHGSHTQARLPDVGSHTQARLPVVLPAICKGAALKLVAVPATRLLVQ
jgi:hypothetical protein